MTPIEELEAALAWADNKITPAQRMVLHNHSSESYCQASETILAREVRRLEADNAELREQVAMRTAQARTATEERDSCRIAQSIQYGLRADFAKLLGCEGTPTAEQIADGLDRLKAIISDNARLRECLDALTAKSKVLITEVEGRYTYRDQNRFRLRDAKAWCEFYVEYNRQIHASEALKEGGQP
jgi:hypothetical protein